MKATPFFVGFVDIDLMVLASQYSKLIVTLKVLNYSENTAEWLDTEKQGIANFSNRIVYESFLERGFNPIKTQFILDPMLAVKPNFISPSTPSFGFQLGNVTLEAELIDLVSGETATTEEFEEGIYIEVKDIA